MDSLILSFKGKECLSSTMVQAHTHIPPQPPLLHPNTLWPCIIISHLWPHSPKFSISLNAKRSSGGITKPGKFSLQFHDPRTLSPELYYNAITSHLRLFIQIEALLRASSSQFHSQSCRVTYAPVSRETKMKVTDSFCSNRSADIANTNTCPTHAPSSPASHNLGYILCNLIAEERLN